MSQVYTQEGRGRGRWSPAVGKYSSATSTDNKVCFSLSAHGSRFSLYGSATVISAWQVIWAVLLWFAINFPRGWLFNIQYLLFRCSNRGWNIWGSIWPVSPGHKTLSRCFNRISHKKVSCEFGFIHHCIMHPSLMWFVALVYMISCKMGIRDLAFMFKHLDVYINLTYSKLLERFR